MKQEYVKPQAEIVCIEDPLLLAGSIEEYDGPLNARGYEYIWDKDEDLWDEL